MQKKPNKNKNIYGVTKYKLNKHKDYRGDFTEFFRKEWIASPAPVQWGISFSVEKTLRGVHVHLGRTDYLTVSHGKMLLGLKDIRPNSPTFNDSNLFELSNTEPSMVCIPVGVAHGFYFPEPTTVILGISEYYDGKDEYGCKWDDKDLCINWPCDDPILSEADATAQSLLDLRKKLYKGLRSCL